MTNEQRAPYLGSGDPTRRRTDYYPEWLDRLADDVTMEAAAMDGFVQGAEDVRTVVLAAKSLYEYQDFNTLLSFSRLMLEKFAGTPLAQHWEGTPEHWA